MKYEYCGISLGDDIKDIINKFDISKIEYKDSMKRLYFKFGTCCKNWRGDIFFIEKLNFSDKYQYQWHSAFKFVLNDIDGYENMLTLSKYDKKIRLVFDTHTRAEFQYITIAYSFDELIDGLYLSDN